MLTIRLGAPPAAPNSGLAGYALGGSNKAAYVDGQGQVHELEWTPSSARHADLMG